MTKVRFYRFAAALLVVLLASAPAFAANKDMIELQTKVQALLDAVARLQQSNDERMGVLRDLVQQNSDSVNRMSVTVNALQKQFAADQTTQGGKVDQVSGQVQALNDQLDEIRARMNRLEKAMGDVSNQQQNLAQTIQSMPQPGAVAAPGTAQPVPAPSTPPAAAPPTETAANAPAPVPTTTGRKGSLPAAAVPTAASNTIPVEDLYKAAFNDFMAAHYPVAAAEFNDVIKSYPDSQLAGNAHYYIGEIDYRGAHYSTAVKDYDKVIEQFPDNNKVPAAHLHKGQALVEMQLKEAGMREFKSLIQRFPNSPEAAQARSRLSALAAKSR